MSAREITQAGAVAVGRPAESDEGVTSLVRMAIEKGVDVEVLERLVALQERVTERNARGAYIDALARFQEQCPEIPKNKTAEIVSKRSGARFSYSYARLEDITRTIRQPLKENALSYSWDVELAGQVMNVICSVRHIDGHAERSTFPVPIDKSDRMSDAQSSGAALTYGKRQSLIAVLGLTTADDDVDGADVRSRRNGTDESAEGARLNDDQLANLSALIDEVGANKSKFLQWLDVDSLDAVDPRDYTRAVQALESRRGA